MQRNSLDLTQQPKDRLEVSLCEYIQNFIRGRMSKNKKSGQYLGRSLGFCGFSHPGETRQPLPGAHVRAPLPAPACRRERARVLRQHHSQALRSQTLLLTYVVVGVITPFLFSFYDTVQGYSYCVRPIPQTTPVVKKGARGTTDRNSRRLGRSLALRCAVWVQTVTRLPRALPLYPRHFDSRRPNQTWPQQTSKTGFCLHNAHYKPKNRDSALKSLGQI